VRFYRRRQIFCGHLFQGGGCRLQWRGYEPRQGRADERAYENQAQDDADVDPHSVPALLRDAVGALHSRVCIEIEVVVHCSQGNVYRIHCRIGHKEPQRAVNLAFRQQGQCVIAVSAILFEGSDEFLVLFALAGRVDKRLVGFHGRLILVDRRLAFLCVTRSTGGSLAEQEIEIFAPDYVDSSADGGQMYHRGEAVLAHLNALGRNVAEGEEGIGAQDETEATHKAKREGEFAGHGKVAK